jgi:hypothetical protein
VCLLVDGWLHGRPAVNGAAIRTVGERDAEAAGYNYANSARQRPDA